MPEDDEKPAATAEPETPETPQLGEQPSPTEETAPAAEQEQPEGEKPKGDSETQEQEEEAPSLDQTVEALGGMLDELKESNPDLAKKLQEKLGVGDADRLGEQEREFTKREVEQAQTDRQSSLARAVEAVGSFTPQGIQQATRTWSDAIAQQVSSAAQELVKAGEGDTNLIDAGAIAQQVSGYLTNAVLVWSTYSNEQHSATVFDVLEADDAHGHLTADAKRTLREGRSKPLSERISEALPLYLAAARRSAPEVKGKASAEEAANKLETAKIAQNIMNALGKNGARKANTPEPRDKRTDDEILMDPETSIEDIRKITARRRDAA